MQLPEHGHDMISPSVLELAETLCPAEAQRLMHETLSAQGLTCWCEEDASRSAVPNA